eukprot:TRINITY_DN15676_c0_g4_i2.p1 TRINITY_DN15676_c0_g4~~TRINITY_DN15676_c0_g4_i2.p1  ORF type:complete len:267 (+),score=38.96 TRINITY_DN15676_c0_g4_i2:89-802(+)
MKTSGSFATARQGTKLFLKGSTIEFNPILFDKQRSEESTTFTIKRPTSMQPKNSPYKKEGGGLLADQLASTRKAAAMASANSGSRTSRVASTNSQLEMIYGGKKKIKVLVPGSYKPPIHSNTHRILSGSGSVTARVRGNYEKPIQNNNELRVYDQFRSNVDSTLATNVSLKYSLHKPPEPSKQQLLKVLERMKAVLGAFKARREKLLKENEELKLEREKLKLLLITRKCQSFYPSFH